MPLRRLAKAAVNFSGMCWTTTMPGAMLRQHASSTSRRVSVPPVEMPMQTMRSVVQAGAASRPAAA